MLAIRLPAEIEARLSELAARTGRTKTFYAKEAILQHLDEMEDRYLAISRLENPGKPLSGDLAGLWRYRVRDYRMICNIEGNRLIVLVVRVAHRKDIYD